MQRIPFAGPNYSVAREMQRDGRGGAGGVGELGGDEERAKLLQRRAAGCVVATLESNPATLLVSGVWSKKRDPRKGSREAGERPLYTSWFLVLGSWSGSSFQRTRLSQRLTSV